MTKANGRAGRSSLIDPRTGLKRGGGLTMKKITGTLVMVALVATALAVGCARKPEEIKIGAVLPMTGDAAVYGEPLKQGMELALNRLMDEGGVSGKKLTIIYEDSRAEPKTAVSATNKLIQIDKVPMIIGDMFSATTLAMAPIAQKAGVTILSPTASAEAVPNAGDCIFTIFPSDVYEGEKLGSFVVLTKRGTTLGIIYPQADAMATIREKFRNTVEELGGKIVFDESYLPGTTDFRSILTKARTANPSMIFVPTYLDDLSRILRQAKELRVETRFVTISTALDDKLFELAGDAAENVIFTAPFYDSESEIPEIKEFVHYFDKKYGKVPNIWSAYGYDALYIAALAFKNAAMTHSTLNQALLSMGEYPGVTGKTSFLENGGVEKTLRMMTVKDQKFETIE